MKKRKCKKGLTLIELMVTIAAASILILTVGLIMIMAFRAWRMNNAFVELRRDSAFAFSMMTRDVRESSYTNLIDGIGQLRAISNNPPATYQLLTITNASQVLTYNDGSGLMRIIPKNVQNFRTLKTNDGVQITLELENDEFGISYINEVFVNTRN